MSEQQDPKNKRKGNVELVSRIISALVLAALALFADYLGGALFSAFWVGAAVLVFYEWLGLVGVHGRNKVSIFLLGVATLSISAYFAHDELDNLNRIYVPVIGALVGIIILSRRSLRQSLWSCAGLIYSSVLVVSLIALRGNSTEGFLAILWLFGVVWAADIGAFFVGRSLGGPKLWPSISPKKTWSGFIGGVFLGAVAGFLVATIGQELLSVVWFQGVEVFVFSLGGALISQAGDLFESALKRRFHQKDSGHLIPGHGGIMDRLDSFVAAAFYAFLMVYVFGLAPLS